MVQENGVSVGMKHYPAEFKADAVALYRSRPEATIKSVAGDLRVKHRDAVELDQGRRRAPPRHPLTNTGDPTAPPRARSVLRDRPRGLGPADSLRAGAPCLRMPQCNGAGPMRRQFASLSLTSEGS